jgi:hypothetical protein
MEDYGILTLSRLLKTYERFQQFGHVLILFFGNLTAIDGLFIVSPLFFTEVLLTHNEDHIAVTEGGLTSLEPSLPWWMGQERSGTGRRVRRSGQRGGLDRQMWDWNLLKLPEMTALDDNVVIVNNNNTVDLNLSPTPGRESGRVNPAQQKVHPICTRRP